MTGVRPGEASDLPFVVEMARFASVIEDCPLPDPASVEGLPPSPAAVVVAVEGGVPVGAAWWTFRSLIEEVPELVVGVLPAARDRGVGRLLLDALAARAVAHGFAQISLNVHIRNPAARLYSRCGFEVAGKGRGPLGVAMVRHLP